MLLSPLILVAVLPTGSFAISTSGQDDPDSSPGPFDFDITRHTIEESEVHARRSGHSPLGPRGVNLDTKLMSKGLHVHTISVTIATQAMILYMDSGSTQTWVYSEQCKTPICEAIRKEKDSNLFNPMQGGFVKDKFQFLDVLYVFGGGEEYGDNTQVFGQTGTAPFNMGYLQIPKASILSANKGSVDWHGDTTINGIMALGPPSRTSIWDKLLNAHPHLDKQFGLHLAQRSDMTLQGKMTLGGTNPACYTGAIHFVNVQKRGPIDQFFEGTQWRISLIGFRSDDSLDWKPIKSQLAHIDNGQELSSAPKDVVKFYTSIFGECTLRKQSSGNELCSVAKTNGNMHAAMPDCHAEFQFSDKTGNAVTIRIPVKAFLNDNGEEYWWGSLMPSDGWAFGNSVLEHVYTVFHAEPLKIGFGVRQPC